MHKFACGRRAGFDIIGSECEDMTQRGEIAQGENVALEFKEARPKDSFKRPKAVGAFSN